MSLQLCRRGDSFTRQTPGILDVNSTLESIYLGVKKCPMQSSCIQPSAEPYGRVSGQMFSWVWAPGACLVLLHMHCALWCHCLHFTSARVLVCGDAQDELYRWVKDQDGEGWKQLSVENQSTLIYMVRQRKQAGAHLQVLDPANKQTPRGLEAVY